MSWTWNRPAAMLETEFREMQERISSHLNDTFPKCKYIYQLERGVAAQRLHYQGCLKLEVKHRTGEVANKCKALMPGVHITPNSNLGSTDAEFYCMKDDTKVAGPWADPKHIMPDYSDLVAPEGWQVMAKEILTAGPEPRKIYWLFEDTGKTGKSQFATYMEVYHGVIGLGLGTATDNFFAVSELPARAYIFDVPRTQPKRFDWAEVYMSIEKIKDRNFLSTKYKPKKVILPVIPHVMIFSNQLPDKAALSMDRWEVFKIVGNTLIRWNDKF
jgi:hypothetical protein